MGRNKAKKPKKQKKYIGADLAASLGPYDSDQLWTLLTAAGASPALRAHWVSVAELVSQVAKSPSKGSKDVAAGLIVNLIQAAHLSNPDVAKNEDYMPADPRKDVRVRSGRSTVRLFPGCVERPVADVDRAYQLAGVLDDELVAANGFGISHLLQVVLGYADYAIRQFESAWPTEGNPNGDSSASLTPSEIEAATALVAAGTPSHLESSEELRKALAWLTCDASSLRYKLGDSQSFFGRFVRCRPGGQEDPRWLPLAFLPEALNAAVAELAETVSEQPSVRRKFAQVAAAEVRKQLWRFTDHLIGSPDVQGFPAVTPANVVQWVLPAGENLALLVQLAVDLTADSIRFPDVPAALKAAQGSSSLNGEVEVPLPAGTLRLPASTVLVPLLVVATAEHVATPQPPGIAMMSLEDLRWIATSADSEYDLLNFCRDLIRADVPNMFGFETINYWEWWRSNGKSFFSGGKAPSFMSIAPHWGEKEWLRAASWTQTEIALATLNLPALRETPGPGHVRAGGPTEVCSWNSDKPAPGSSFVKESPGRSEHLRPKLKVWSVHLGRIPVAITYAEGSTVQREHRQLLVDLAGGMAFGLKAVDDAWVTAHADTDIAGHVLTLQIADDTEDGSRFISTKNVSLDVQSQISYSTLEIAFDTFLVAGDGNPDTIKEEMATSIYEVLLGAKVPEEKAAQTEAAWRSARASMTLNVTSSPTSQNNLRAPVLIDRAYLSTVDRLVAESVHQQGIKPGLYVGEEAKALDRDILANSALSLLQSRLAGYSGDQLVLFAMEQLERTVSYFDRRLRGINESARSLDLEWNPIDLAARTTAESITIRRCNEIVVEGALRFSPTGNSALNDVSWGEILAAANAYLEATMRSENVHNQVTPSALKISESFEISVVTPPEDTSPVESERLTYNLDSNAYNEALARHRLAEDSWDETEPDAKFHEAVEQQMLKAFGAASQDIYTTLYTLAHWQIDGSNGDVVSIPKESLIDTVTELSGLADEEGGAARVSAAVDMLTSFQSSFQLDEWRPWHARTRKRRLLIQPLPVLTSEEYVIAPHYLITTLRVYMQYLDQGQLPWSQPQPPAALDKALAQFRDAKNKALESDIAQQLIQRGWQVETNIKENKAKRLNLPSLSTEIDAVAGRSGEKTIWLLEAKDPVSVHAIPDIRRHLDTFFLDGKKPAYATQLKRKLDDLSAHAAQVASALKLPERDAADPYEVRAVFVTRRPVPAAFVPGQFTFFTVAELLQELGKEQPYR